MLRLALISVVIVVFSLLSPLITNAEDSAPLTAKIVSVEKIWDAAEHNAFTDLIRWKDRFYCIFREAKTHVSADGRLRLLTSADGETWKPAALLTSDVGDLRDAKLSITPRGELMISSVVWTPNDANTKHQSLAYFSQDGEHFEGPIKIGEPNFWLWRTSWHKDIAYNIGYATHGTRQVRLYRSDNAREFKTHVERLDVKNEYPNESALAWDADDTAYCVLRCEKPNIAQLGSASPPYQDWQWRELDQAFGGPSLLRLPSGQFIAAGRIYQPQVHTSVCWLDVKGAKLVELASLPSGGDTSYPGLVWHDDLLWVSYYSSHAGKTSIYLAKVKLAER